MRCYALLSRPDGFYGYIRVGNASSSSGLSITHQDVNPSIDWTDYYFGSSARLGARFYPSSRGGNDLYRLFTQELCGRQWYVHVRNTVCRLIIGTSPGPLLRFTEGEHYWVRVYNDLPHENTTMHWHGFTQFLSPFSDGTPQVSGWPIPPGHFYDYEFQLQMGHYGTYW